MLSNKRTLPYTLYKKLLPTFRQMPSNFTRQIPTRMLIFWLLHRKYPPILGSQEKCHNYWHDDNTDLIPFRLWFVGSVRFFSWRDNSITFAHVLTRKYYWLVHSRFTWIAGATADLTDWHVFSEMLPLVMLIQLWVFFLLRVAIRNFFLQFFFLK